MNLPNKHINQEWSNAFGDRARELAAKAREAAERAFREAKAAKDKADALAREAAEKGSQLAKDAANKAKSDAEKLLNAAKKLDAKIKKGIKNLTGKAFSGANKLIKKAILKRFATAIKMNVHGIASRLYPAITNEANVKKAKIKASYIPKSKATYSDVLKEWIALGGNQYGLNQVIMQGYKTKFHAFSGADAGVLDPTSNLDDSHTPDYSIESVSAEEASAMAEQGADTTEDTVEKVKGFKALWLKILSLFKRKGADENPYEEGTSEYSEVDRMPNPEEVEKYQEGGDAGELISPTIMGINKTYFWGGVALLSLTTITLVVLYKKGIIFKG